MTVALAGCALLFFAFTILTSNTGNILAWGFTGLPSLGNSGLSLFVYELVHATSAYGGFLMGLWLVGLAAAVLFFCRIISSKLVRKTLWMIWGLGTVSFIAFNGVLFIHPDTTHASQYFMMLVTDPLAGEDYNISPIRFWFFVPPAIIALFFLIPSLRKISGSVQAIIQTMPLFAVPFVTANYLSYHYSCFGNPDVYTGVLNVATPFLIFAPVALFTYFTLRTNQGKAQK